MTSPFNEAVVPYSTVNSFFLLLAISVLATYCNEVDNIKVEQICSWHKFEPTCPPAHVIVINRAMYGRMRTGKCLVKDARPTCSADVKPELDKACSARITCSVEVPNSELHKRLPCGEEMLSYLEVSYECLKVAAVQETCKEVKQLKLNSSEGFLSSAMAAQRGWGQKYCPWLISVTPGRGIQLYLQDFGINDKSTGRNAPHLRPNASASKSANFYLSANAPAFEDSQHIGLPQCRVYATVREMNSATKPKETLICSTGSRDEILTFSSTSSVVEVTMQVSSSDATSPNFLLRFEATGCANFAPPADATVVRQWIGHESISRVSCNFSKVESELVCEGSEWKGELKNCSSTDLSLSLNSGDKSFMSSVGVVISIILGVIVGVVCGSIVLGLIILWKRRHIQQRYRNNSHLRDVTASYTAAGQAYPLTLNSEMDGSIPVSERPTFLELVDSNGVPIAVYRSMRRTQNGSGSALMTLEHVYESPRFDPVSGELLRKSPMPRSSSLGRNVPHQLMATMNNGTLPRMGVATRVTMTPANHDLCRDCQAMATSILPLRHNDSINISSETEDSPLPLNKSNHVLKTFKTAKEAQTSDFRETNENQYS